MVSNLQLCASAARGGGRAGRGRGRGRRGRRCNDESEDTGVITMEEWEARKAGRSTTQVNFLPAIFYISDDICIGHGLVGESMQHSYMYCPDIVHDMTAPMLVWFPTL